MAGQVYSIFILFSFEHFHFPSLGEVCSHVAAVLFKIEAAFRVGYTKPSCTSMPCKWNKMFVDKVKILVYVLMNGL